MSSQMLPLFLSLGLNPADPSYQLASSCIRLTHTNLASSTQLIG